MIIKQIETKFDLGEEVFEANTFHPMLVRGILVKKNSYDYLVNTGLSSMAYYPEEELLSEEEYKVKRMLSDLDNSED